jgi:beta-glucosidase/6-phospho-beta-glucosidase/beta-galactosidase
MSHVSALDGQAAKLRAWADAQIEEHPGTYFVPEIRPVQAASAAEKRRNAETVALYKQTFRSLLWTGFECSNPLLGEQRWDQNELAGFYDPKERRSQLETMRGLGIENARIALPNDRMVKNGKVDWKPFDEILADFEKAGVKVSVDVIHFGLPDDFHVPEDKKRSDFLNPKWPDHFAELAIDLVKRHPKIEAITLINEPFVTNNFSSGHWNEAVGGNEAFIDRALLMAKAAVKARAGIEDVLSARGERKIFLHNESCEFRSDDADFVAHKRFLSSDLILGADWLLQGDFEKSDTFQWMAKEYDQSAEGRARLCEAVREIRDAHVSFEKKHGKSMKADTVFGMDYYVACESGPGVTHDPVSYVNEAQKTRKGLYEMGQDYYARYRLPLFHAETNMREDQAERWMTQQLVELSSLMKSGVPVLGATWYSLMDQFGWDNGLNGEVLKSVEDAQAKGRLNPIGLISIPGHEPRASAKLMKELGQILR